MAKKNKDKSRTAIWSVRTKRRNTFFGMFHTQLLWIVVSNLELFRDATGVGYNIPRDCRLNVESDNCPCCIYIIFYGGLQNVIGRV